MRSDFFSNDIFSPLAGGCSEGLGAFRFFFKHPHAVLECQRLEGEITRICFRAWERGGCHRKIETHTARRVLCVLFAEKNKIKRGSAQLNWNILIMFSKRPCRSCRSTGIKYSTKQYRVQYTVKP